MKERTAAKLMAAVTMGMAVTAGASLTLTGIFLIGGVSEMVASASLHLLGFATVPNLT